MARIVVANKFYYPRGGDCVYTINLMKMLESQGHDVAVFAMQYPGTQQTPWSRYFPEEVRFGGSGNILKAIMRPFGSKDVRRKFRDLLDDFTPDIVHLNNIHSQLSPVIAEQAKERGCKVIWTLHDYKLLCPRYDCLRRGETPCEMCFRDKCSVLKYKCMKNSALGSLLAYGEAVCWNRERLEAFVDRFICPSRFMKEKMYKGGFDNHKLSHLPNFIQLDKCGNVFCEKDDYYCFVGRLSPEKGVKTLIQAANRLPYHLKIVGGGILENELKELAGPHITFVGFKQWEEVKEIVGKAKFSVIPSECYENNPFSGIESLCLGTPLLGARIGGIPELIEGGVNGLTFESKDAEDLSEKIERMFTTRFDYRLIAENARKIFRAENYYKQLMNIYGLSE